MQKSYVFCVIKINILLLHLDRVGKMLKRCVKTFPFL